MVKYNGKDVNIPHHIKLTARKETSIDKNDCYWTEKPGFLPTKNYMKYFINFNHKQYLQVGKWMSNVTS